MFRGRGIVRQFELIDPGQIDDLGVDPLFGIDRFARNCNFQIEPLRPSEIDRTAHAVINRAEDGHTVLANAIARRKQLIHSIDPQRNMLHRAGGGGRTAMRSMAGPQHAIVRFRARHLHEGDRALVVQLEEPVPGPLDPVHPV